MAVAVATIFLVVGCDALTSPFTPGHGMAFAKDGESGGDDGGHDGSDSSGHGGDGDGSSGKGGDDGSSGKGGDDATETGDSGSGGREKAEKAEGDDSKRVERFLETLREHGSVTRASRSSGLEVKYSDGWAERIRDGRYSLRDRRDRVVVDRPARGSDLKRLEAAARQARQPN